MSRLVVETDLGPVECFRLIEARTDSWDASGGGDSTGNLMARLSPPRFKLTTHSSIRYRGTKVIFYGRLKRVAGRTKVYGRLGLSVSAILFISLIIAMPAAGQTYALEWMPGPERFELRVPFYWVIVLLFMRVVGAWDCGGPADRYSAFLEDTLSHRAATGAVGHPPRD